MSQIQLDVRFLNQTKRHLLVRYPCPKTFINTGEIIENQNCASGLVVSKWNNFVENVNV